MFLRRVTFIALVLFVSLMSCTNKKPVDALSIIMQLPEQERIALLPDDLAVHLKNDFNVMSFSDIDSIQVASNIAFTEDEFYQKARSLDVQYIIVSSEMIVSTDHNFPWITNKKFRVCPGNIDHNTDRYYILLIWDNAKYSYHFFKFLYENESQ